MPIPESMQKKVNALTALLFFITLFILIFFKEIPIWASVMASCFLSITLRQFLIGKILDIFVSMILFALLFTMNSFYYSEFWTGILLLIGSGYIFVKPCLLIYNDLRE